MLALTGALICTGTITASAVEVTPGSDYNNSIAIIVSEEGKEDRTNRDFRVSELPVELLKDGQLISKDTSDEMGVAIFDNVEPGEYEIKMPESYKGLTLVKDKAEGKISIEKGKHESLEISYNGNVSKQARAPEDDYRGKLHVKVVDDKGKPISGSEVIVQGVTDKNYQTGFVTDSKGEIYVSNMKPGQYVLKQIPSSVKKRGYELSKDVYNINVNETDKLVTIENKVVGNFIEAKDIPKENKKENKDKPQNENKPPKVGDIMIQIANPSEKKEVKDIEVEVFKEGVEEPIKTVKTDKYGAISLTGLDTGIYQYRVLGSDKRVEFNIANYDALLTLGEKAKKEKKANDAKITKSKSSTMISLFTAGAVVVVSLAVVLLRKFKRSRRRD